MPVERNFTQVLEKVGYKSLIHLDEDEVLVSPTAEQLTDANPDLGGGGGGDVSTDAIWTAAEQLAYSTGVETADVFVMGTGVRTFLTTPSGANLNSLLTGNIVFSPASQTVTISPTGGTGSVYIQPEAAGSMDNMVIGATTRQSGAFTTLAANSTGQITGTLTLGDGSGATAILASNLSGATDPTITFGNSLVTVSNAVTITAGDLTIAGTATIRGGDADSGITFNSDGRTMDWTRDGTVIARFGTTTGLATSLSFGTSGTNGDTPISRLAAGVLGIPGLASTPQAVATTDGAAAAVNLTTLTSTYVTGASSATTTTLAAGTNGQIKIIDLITDGGQNLVVTVTNPFWGGAGTLTFDDAGDNVMLIYLNSKWVILANNGVAAA